MLENSLHSNRTLNSGSANEVGSGSQTVCRKGNVPKGIVGPWAEAQAASARSEAKPRLTYNLGGPPSP